MKAFVARITSGLSWRLVRIADCVHYCGFRYGRGEFNPYENYVVGLASHSTRDSLRAAFIEFLRYYRPRDLGEALGTRTERPIPLWLLPWKSWRKLARPGAWSESPEAIVDIMTHFSPKGIPLWQIEREYFWLEQAWETISTKGYQPERYSYINVFELHGPTESRFLVLDGNHRLSALAALGEREVIVRQLPWSRAHRACARYWPLVLSGHITLEDALRIFDAYFNGNIHWYRALEPAPILNS